MDDRDVVWNPIFDSLLRLYQKLIDLGFTYFEGKVSIIEIKEEDSRDSQLHDEKTFYKAFLRDLEACKENEEAIQEIERDLRVIKQKYYQNPDVEIKSNFLRYANPDLTESSPLKLNSKQKYDELEAEVNAFLQNIPVVLFSVVINKEKYWEKYPAQNPYDIAYIFLLERFQKYLDGKKALGISIIDPREGQVEKHFMGEELDRIHNKMRWEESEFWAKCPRIVEKLLFSQSDKTIGIQIADLYCYPIFNVFELVPVFLLLPLIFYLFLSYDNLKQN